MPKKEEKRIAEFAAALERLREAESFVGSEMTQMFLDNMNPEHRLGWLRLVRSLLRQCNIPVENLSGRWHT
jgi:predicted Zn-dependent peptidase